MKNFNDLTNDSDHSYEVWAARVIAAEAKELSGDGDFGYYFSLTHDYSDTPSCSDTADTFSVAREVLSYGGRTLRLPSME